MATPRRNSFVVPKTTGRDYLNAFMHLLEAAYWGDYTKVTHPHAKRERMVNVTRRATN